MDTHIPPLSASESLADPGLPPQASRPGDGFYRQPEPPQPDAPQPDATLPAARPCRWVRTVLWTTVSTAAIAAAAGVFLLSPYNTVIPIDTAGLEREARQFAASVGVPGVEPSSAIVAPAARVAGNGPRPVTKPLYREPAKPSAAQNEADEVLSLYPNRLEDPTGGHDPEGPAPRPSASRPSGLAAAPRPAPPPPPPPDGTGEVGAGTPTPAAASRPEPLIPPSSPAIVRVDLAAAAPSTVALAEDPSPPPALPASQAPAAPDVPQSNPDQPHGTEDTARPGADPAASVAGHPKPDPVQASLVIQAAPMAQDEQIQVLNLVTQLGTFIRDLKTENVALAASNKAVSEKLDASLADFNRRLSMAEAREAIKAASSGDEPIAHAAPRGAAAGGAAPRAQAARAASAPASGPGPLRYRVQAASPGLAMLVELDRNGGGGTPLQVQVGEQVPGYGRVIAIQQQGASWVVATERGPIQ